MQNSWSIAECAIRKLFVIRRKRRLFISSPALAQRLAIRTRVLTAHAHWMRMKPRPPKSPVHQPRILLWASPCSYSVVSGTHSALTVDGTANNSSEQNYLFLCNPFQHNQTYVSMTVCMRDWESNNRWKLKKNNKLRIKFRMELGIMKPDANRKLFWGWKLSGLRF